MKRVILLGFAILLAGSMAMAADIDFNADGNLSGDYTGDNLHIAVTTDAAITVDANLTCDALLVADTTADATGSVTVNAGVIADVGTFNISAGWMGTLTVEGTLNCSGLFNFDGNGAQYNPDTGLYGQINVSGSGEINAGAHLIFGGYDANYQVDVNLSGSAKVEASTNRTYIGAVSGSGSVTMSGSATLCNYTKTAGIYDNTLYVGWTVGTGLLTVESGNTVEFRNIDVNPTGTVDYILDAAGQACVLRPTLPPEVDPETENVDSYFTCQPGSVLNVDTTGVGVGLLIPGFAVDLAEVAEYQYLRWDGSYQASLTVDGSVNAQWQLREKPGSDGTILQARIIPEPTTIALLGLGGLLVALRRRS